MKYDAVVVAAGVGKRTGLTYNKVLYQLDDETVIEKSIRNFINDEDCQSIIIVVSESEIDDFKAVISNKKVQYAFGGAERQHSVYNGLLKVESPYVLIHDGARPYLSECSLNDLKKALKYNNAALLMVESIDTSKIVKNGYVQKTIDRSTLYHAQTPQAFKTKVILSAYEKLREANDSVTDDVQVVEKYSSEKIAVVVGEVSNIKITTKEHL